MDRDSMKQLRMDRRLTRRRGWIAPAEVEKELAALPDATEKATTLGEAADKGKPVSGSPASETPGS